MREKVVKLKIRHSEVNKFLISMNDLVILGDSGGRDDEMEGPGHGELEAELGPTFQPRLTTDQQADLTQVQLVSN